MASDICFQVKAINGLMVRTTHAYWRKIITFKHPAMARKEEEVKLALHEPDEIRQSVRNESVLLYYRNENDYFTCVVVRVLNDEGFIITAYITDRVKEGKRIWRR